MLIASHNNKFVYHWSVIILVSNLVFPFIHFVFSYVRYIRVNCIFDIVDNIYVCIVNGA